LNFRNYSGCLAFSDWNRLWKAFRRASTCVDAATATAQAVARREASSQARFQPYAWAVTNISTFNVPTFNVPTFNAPTFPRSTLNVRNYSAAWRSAIEIASGRLFAGRPPAWTLPRRPPRRSPGAKRPLRRGFNRTPEQLRTFNLQRATFLLPVKSLMPCDT